MTGVPEVTDGEISALHERLDREVWGGSSACPGGPPIDRAVDRPYPDCFVLGGGGNAVSIGAERYRSGLIVVAAQNERLPGGVGVP